MKQSKLFVIISVLMLCVEMIFFFVIFKTVGSAVLPFAVVGIVGSILSTAFVIKKTKR